MDKLQTQEQVQLQVQTQVNSQLQPQPNLTDEIVYFEGNVPDYCMISNKKWIFGKSIIPINQVSFIDFVQKKSDDTNRKLMFSVGGTMTVGGIIAWIVASFFEAGYGIAALIFIIGFVCLMISILKEPYIYYAIVIGTGQKTFDIIVDYDEAKIVYDIMSKALNERTF